ncbi:Acb2/Tad1 domain-containing protein [Nocardiopsis terrae]|uniref:Acb2/Tad1 domain-containing protein n=1 Tax=Streptomyces sp. NPDC057554 TaxID=3350538 RepID=UPI00367888A7
MSRPNPDLDHLYKHHPPKDQVTITAHETIRGGARAFAQIITEMVPDSPERKRALDAVDDAMWRANAGIARGARPQSGPCRCNPRLRTKTRNADDDLCPGPVLRDAAREVFGETNDG